MLLSGSLHDYVIVQQIQLVLRVEEGSLYPALQIRIENGWIVGEWGIAETGRRVSFYALTRKGKRQLKEEIAAYEQVSAAIQSIIREA